MSILAFLFIFLGVLSHPGWTQETSVPLKIDCSQSRGTISPYLFGTIAGPFYDSKGLALAKEAGFTAMETCSYMGKPGSPEGETPSRPPGMGQPGPGGQPPWGAMGQRPISQGPIPNDQPEVKRQLEECFRLGLPVIPHFTINRPPRNPREFQEDVRQGVQVMQEMARRHGTRIKIFTFGNEPELMQFWNGTPTEFFQTYALWVKTVKAVDPQAIVVAPGFASPFEIPHQPGRWRSPSPPPSGSGTPVLSSLIKDFLGYCDRHALPLDVLAFHGYGVDPYYNFGLPTKMLSDYLKKYPRMSPAFGVPKLAINEWNHPMEPPSPAAPYNRAFDTAWMAAHHAASLIEMLRNGVYISIRWGATCINPYKQDRSDSEPDFLLVTKGYGKKPNYYAVAGINRFAKYPDQVAAASLNRNYEVSAGLSAHKDALYIAVCHFPIFQYVKIAKPNPYIEEVDKPNLNKIALQNPDSPQYQLQLLNLPFASKGNVRLRRYRVDDKNSGQLIEDQNIPAKGSLTLNRILAGPGVDFILLEAAK
jgi:hypothetical protein